MALTVTFTKGTTTLILPAPQPGANVSSARVQAAGRAAGGGIYVYDAGQQRFGKDELFMNLTAAQKIALSAFFHLVIGQQQTFTYTDSNGTVFTARFLTSEIEFKKHAPDCWDTNLALELNALGE